MEVPAVNPIVSPRLDVSGRLAFDNAAVDAGVAGRPDGYRAEWYQFDNTTGMTRRIGETASETTALDAPPGLPSGIAICQHCGASWLHDLSVLGVS